MNTGKVIVECVKKQDIDSVAIPGALVRNHGPFSWGKTVTESVFNSVVMETVAEMNIKTMLLNPKASLPRYILNKHYLRKHGANAYYGQ